jgi:hypothetical protein
MNWGIALACGMAIWPGFRGPNGAGVDTESRGCLWKSRRTGMSYGKQDCRRGRHPRAHARDRRIFLTAFEPEKLLTMALDRASGRVLWRRELAPVRKEARHILNNAASATPVTDGVTVYSFFSDFGLAAYGPDGNELWRVPMGPFTNLHGMGASPLLAGDRIIMLFDQDVGSYMIAIDKRTGKQIWRVERQSVVHGFATPTLLADDQIIVPGSYLLMSYSLKTGAELWSVRGLTWQIKNTAVAGADGTIYVTGWAPGADQGESKPLPPFETAAGEIDANKNGRLEASELNPSQYKHGGSWRAIDLSGGAIDARGGVLSREARGTKRHFGRPARQRARRSHRDVSAMKFVPPVSSPLFIRACSIRSRMAGFSRRWTPRPARFQDGGYRARSTLTIRRPADKTRITSGREGFGDRAGGE